MDAKQRETEDLYKKLIHQSLLKNHLTTQVFNNLKAKRTSLGGTQITLDQIMMAEASVFVSIVLCFPVLEAAAVTSCPTSKEEWEKRAANFKCTHDGNSYHCLLDTEGQLVEVCIPRQPIDKVGCPTIAFVNESNELVPYLREDNSPCPITDKLCPSGKKVYYTDTMYLYPKCYRNETARLHYEVTDTDRDDIKKSSTQGPITNLNKIHSKSQITSSYNILLIFAGCIVMELI